MGIFLLGRVHLFLLPSLMLRFTQSLSLIDSPTLGLDTRISTTATSNITSPDGGRVPGRSPFTYVGSLAKNLLRIDSLDMSPNPSTL